MVGLELRRRCATCARGYTGQSRVVVHLKNSCDHVHLVPLCSMVCPGVAAFFLNAVTVVATLR